METEPDRVPGKVKAKMKKLMIVAMAALWGTVGFADVESSNVVGYQMRGEGEEIYNVGVQFKNIGVADGSFEIADTIMGRTVEEGDRIFIYDVNMSNVEEYEYIGGDDGWHVTWADGSDGFVTSISIKKGENFSYWPVTEGALSIAGEVEDISKGFVVTLVADEIVSFTNPFPKDVTVRDTRTFAQEGDRYFFYDVGMSNVEEYEYVGGDDGWYVTKADGTEGYISNDDDVLIPAGQGGAYWPIADSTWTVNL